MTAQWWICRSTDTIRLDLIGPDQIRIADITEPNSSLVRLTPEPDGFKRSFMYGPPGGFPHPFIAVRSEQRPNCGRWEAYIPISKRKQITNWQDDGADALHELPEH